MNGPRFAVTWRFDVGDRCPFLGELSLDGGHLDQPPRMRVTAYDPGALTATLRCECGTWSHESTHGYTPGGDWHLEIRADEDLPENSVRRRIEFWLDGALVAVCDTQAYSFLSGAGVLGVTHKLPCTGYPVTTPAAIGHDASPAGWDHTFTATDLANIEAGDDHGGGFLPPVGGPPLVRRDGSWLVARLDRALSGAAGTLDLVIWRRARPDAAWSEAGRLPGAGLADGSTTVWPLLHGPFQADTGVPDRVWCGGLGAEVVSDDEGLTWVGGDPVNAATAALAHEDGQLGVVCPFDLTVLGTSYWAWRFHDDTLSFALDGPFGSGQPVCVTTAARGVGDGGARAWPWLACDDQGWWRVGCFAGGRYREWRAAPQPTTFAMVESVAVAGCDLTATGWAAGRDGTQGVVGHDAGSGAMRVLHRGGWERAWQGPVTVAARDRAVAPYLAETATGWWEAGWLVGGSWECWVAPHPAGPWSVR
jgi:hypothetical protein